MSLDCGRKLEHIGKADRPGQIYTSCHCAAIYTNATLKHNFVIQDQSKSLSFQFDICSTPTYKKDVRHQCCEETIPLLV